MGWISKLVHKDTDLICTLKELQPSISAHGFHVERAEDAFLEGKRVQRLRVQRGGLKLMMLWDGAILTILQKFDLKEDPDIREMQNFHLRNNYFALAYGLPGRTLIVRHTIHMSDDMPIIAGSVRRILTAWEKHLDLTAIVKH
ncbi:hypothetical protein [uncultured Salinicola sp.]|uniref:hypothetical protein n=1 Tax=uncultured Salinicola sp. TaxID=1193542 RepID=UPI00263623D6|nr:hypothetical protein [uncultured Salinicola sp.]|tara:strand:- start:7037 stop:7465 length:429 start_codon:yes stop_codon:yes gene_type:complete